MDKVQYRSIAELVNDDDLIVTRKTEEINAILGIDIDNLEDAKVLKEKVLASTDTITITNQADNTVTVDFNGFATTAPTFGIAFIANLLNVLAERALDKFLPEPQQPKEASGAKRDGLGSPMLTRALPIKGSY